MFFSTEKFQERLIKQENELKEYDSKYVLIKIVFELLSVRDCFNTINNELNKIIKKDNKGFIQYPNNCLFSIDMKVIVEDEKIQNFLITHNHPIIESLYDNLKFIYNGTEQAKKYTDEINKILNKYEENELQYNVAVTEIENNITLLKNCYNSTIPVVNKLIDGFKSTGLVTIDGDKIIIKPIIY